MSETFALIEANIMSLTRDKRQAIHLHKQRLYRGKNLIELPVYLLNNPKKMFSVAEVKYFEIY